MNKQLERLITAAGIAALVFCFQVAYGKMSKEYVYEFDLQKTVHRILYMAMTHVRSEQSNS
jgi:hypothetical protein